MHPTRDDRILRESRPTERLQSFLQKRIKSSAMVENPSLRGFCCRPAPCPPHAAPRNWLYLRDRFAATIATQPFIVNISSAIFDCSAPDLDSCPDVSLPEFAFIGRSNAGKSSLLNMLSGRRDLARVSPTPGFTKLINIFTVDKAWRLVDLPGYGFAQVARKDSARFNEAVANYLQHRKNLCFVFTLIDSGLTPQKIDLEFVEWLARRSVPFVLVFTKTDKVTPATVQANIVAFRDRISGWFKTLPGIFTCSSRTKQGRTELLGMIGVAMAAIKAKSPQAPQDHEVSPEDLPVTDRQGQKARKRRPDVTRPW
jgi:GTP-binding protein